MAVGKETEPKSAKGRISTQEIIRWVFLTLLGLGLLFVFIMMFSRGR